jgi:hypothetical protein
MKLIKGGEVVVFMRDRGLSAWEGKKSCLHA